MPRYGNNINVIGSKLDTVAGDSLVSLNLINKAAIDTACGGSDILSEARGNSAINRAVTATLYVSPNGDNSDGNSWTKAYQTIQEV